MAAVTALAAGPDAADAALVAALREDLDAGFARLVETHRDLVFSLALRHTACHADAEDLAAESVLRAYRALREYDDERLGSLALRPWLVTITLNEARNRHRTRSRRPRAADREVPDRPPPAGVDHAEATATRHVLDDHLARLPRVQREAVVLRHVLDLPVSEVAQVLGCAENTVKSHVSRGLARLRASLDAVGGTEQRSTT